MTSSVSIIVPCYNHGIFLTEALSSVLAQTHEDWECIVVNDGSEDDTEYIALDWMKRDSRFRYVCKPNGGLSSARNAGLEAATGSYLQFLDADDMILPTKLASQLAALAERPEGTIAVCDHFPFDHKTREFTPRMYVSPYINTERFKQEVITEWEFRRSIPPHSPLFPASLVREHGLRFCESLRTHEDWAFWCQLFYFSKGICFQYEKLSEFRMRPNSMSNDRLMMAEGFLAATFVLESFYVSRRAPEFVRLVKQIRREVKNNLFPYTPLQSFYAEVRQLIKRQLVSKGLLSPK